MKIKMKQIGDNVVDFIPIEVDIAGRTGLVDVTSELSAAIAALSLPVAMATADGEGVSPSEKATIFRANGFTPVYSAASGLRVEGVIEEPSPGRFAMRVVRVGSGDVDAIGPAIVRVFVPYQFTIQSWNRSSRDLSPQLFTRNLTPVCYSGARYFPALADNAATLANFVEIDGGVRISSGRVFWREHGLQTGKTYYLSQTSQGRLVSSRPASGIIQPILTVEDENTVHVNIQEGVEIETGVYGRVVIGDIGDLGTLGNTLSVSSGNLISARNANVTANPFANVIEIKHPPIPFDAMVFLTIEAFGNTFDTSQLNPPIHFRSAIDTLLVYIEETGGNQRATLHVLMFPNPDKSAIANAVALDGFDARAHLRYQATETLTGETWTDGKPIWRRVVTGTLGTNGQFNDTGLSIPHVDTLLDVTGSMTRADNGLQEFIPSKNISFGVDGTLRENHADAALNGSTFTVQVSYTRNETGNFVGVLTPPALKLVPINTNIRFNMTGGTPPYSYSIAKGSIPSGLALAADTITGIPIDPIGTRYAFTVRVTDSTGKTFDNDYGGVIEPRTWSVVTSETGKLTQDSGTSVKVGSGVDWAKADDTFLVGAPSAGGSGIVYAYKKNNGVWGIEETINAPVFQGEFGTSLAVSNDGNTAIISAPAESEFGQVRAGSVYVFGRTGSDWGFVQRIPSSQVSANGEFGSIIDVASDGLTFAAGRITSDGFTEIIRFNGTSWSTVHIHSTSGDGAVRSLSVAGDGKKVAIGLPFSTGRDGGRVVVLSESGGVWTSSEIFRADGVAGDEFGSTVRFTPGGERLFIGSGCDTAGIVPGKVYLYEESSGTWGELATIVPDDSAAQDFFGSSIDISSDTRTLVIGAKGDGTTSGASYIFEFDGMSYTQSSKLAASDGAVGDDFGASVSLSGDGVGLIVGAPEHDNNFTDSGAVYLFELDATADVLLTQSWDTFAGSPSAFGPFNDTLASEELGRSVSYAKNADVFAVGAPGSQTNGRAFVMRKSAGITFSTEEIVAPEASGEFGYSVALSGDANTLAVSAPLLKKVYVFRYSAGTWTQTATLTSTENRFGEKIAISSDGATIAVSTRDTASQLRIYSSASGAWVDVFNHADANDGDVLSVDVSDDGSRVALGCAASTLEVGGRVLVFTFASGAWTSAVITPIETLTGTDQFGSAVAFANFGASLFVGASGFDGVATDSGKIYGFNLSVGSWTQNAAIEATGIGLDDLFGASLAISSDATTMVVGAPNKTTSATRAGDVYVLTYDGTVWSQALKIVPPSGSGGDLFGGAVAVSGSGRAIAIGALAMDGTQTDSGRVYHYQL